jgi:hypothetical protein
MVEDRSASSIIALLYCLSAALCGSNTQYNKADHLPAEQELER